MYRKRATKAVYATRITMSAGKFDVSSSPLPIPPLKPELYSLTDEAAAFFKQETGIGSPARYPGLSSAPLSGSCPESACAREIQNE